MHCVFFSAILILIVLPNVRCFANPRSTTRETLSAWVPGWCSGARLLSLSDGICFLIRILGSSYHTSQSKSAGETIPGWLGSKHIEVVISTNILLLLSLCWPRRADVEGSYLARTICRDAGVWLVIHACRSGRIHRPLMQVVHRMLWHRYNALFDMSCPCAAGLSSHVPSLFPLHRPFLSTIVRLVLLSES